MRALRVWPGSPRATSACSRWLEEFDQSWEDGRLRVMVRQLPPAPSPLRLPALVELVKIDLRRRWKRPPNRPTSRATCGPSRTSARWTTPPSIWSSPSTRPARPAASPSSPRSFISGSPGWRRRFAVSSSPAPLGNSTGGFAATLMTPVTPYPSPGPGGPSTPRLPGQLPEQFGRYRILQEARAGRHGRRSTWPTTPSSTARSPSRCRTSPPRTATEILERFQREARAGGHAAPPEPLPGLRRRRDRRHPLPDDGLHRGQAAVGPGRRRQAAAARRRAAARRPASWPWPWQEAHRQGIIHRDLKPANVMINAPRASRSSWTSAWPGGPAARASA